LFVDLAVEALVLEHLRPVDAVISRGLVEAEDLLVHLLVGSEHAHKVPDVFRCLIVAIELVEKSLELSLVGA